MTCKTGSHWIAFTLWGCVLSWHINGQTPAAWRTRNLAIDLEDTSVGMGNNYLDFELTNKGNRACRLSGYPSAAALNSKKRVVREISFQQAPPSGSRPKVQEIRLGPGEHAWFEIVSTNPTGKEDVSLCKKATSVRITPPLNKRPFLEIFPFGSCTRDCSISFLLAGTP